MTDRGPYIQTFTGQSFYLLDPRPEDVSIVDIAHSLAKTCRYSGHSRYFYSVAEHSVHVSRACPPELRLEGLLHDAREAYIGDWTTPLKAAMPDYRKLERPVADAVADRFGISREESTIVKEMDRRILLDERARLMPPSDDGWGYPEDMQPLGVQLEMWEWNTAAEIFLEEFRGLIG